MWDYMGGGDSLSIKPTSMNDFDAVLEHLEDDCPRETDLIRPPLREISFRRMFALIDMSVINFVDTDGELIVSAGVDPDIKIWNMKDMEFVRPLIGHTMSVTGLKILDLGPGLKETSDSMVISTSKDATIRQWSLRKGQEVRKITTSNPLTCMGILNKSLVATGNNKGFLEVFHLISGRHFAGVEAHKKPISALTVDGDHICTAVYGPPSSSLHVWMMKWGKLICIYRLQDQYPSIEFSAFAVLNQNVLVVAEVSQPRLHALSITSGERQSVQLEVNQGYVQHIEAVMDILLISTINGDGFVQMHLYLQRGLDHLATFCCKQMERISSMRMINQEGTMKFILGGSSLAILQLDDSENFDCLEELKNRCEITRKSALEQNNISDYLSMQDTLPTSDNNPEEHCLNAELLENPDFKTPESQLYKMEERIKYLSLSNAKELNKYPIEGGKVKLPPISSYKENKSENDGKNCNENPQKLEVDTLNKIGIMEDTEKGTEEGKRTHSVKHFNNRKNEDIGSMAHIKTKSNSAMESDNIHSASFDDGLNLPPLKYASDDSNETVSQCSLKGSSKKKQKGSGLRLEFDVKKRCKIM